MLETEVRIAAFGTINEVKTAKKRLRQQETNIRITKTICIMIFTPGTKVYVRYSTGIMNPFTECLTINKYKNNLLYFKEKTSYYAVECHAASFYGYGYTMAGNVLVAKHKWQIAFADLAEKLKFIVPTKTAKTPAQPSLRMHIPVEAS